MMRTTPAPKVARGTTRTACLAALTLAGVVLTVAAYQAQPERPPITGIQEVAENLYLLGDSDPVGPDDVDGREHRDLRDRERRGAGRHEAPRATGPTSWSTSAA